MTKMDKSITTELNSIINKCVIEKKIDGNVRIQKLGTAFLNDQQI